VLCLACKTSPVNEQRLKAQHDGNIRFRQLWAVHWSGRRWPEKDVAVSLFHWCTTEVWWQQTCNIAGFCHFGMVLRLTCSWCERQPVHACSIARKRQTLCSIAQSLVGRPAGRTFSQTFGPSCKIFWCRINKGGVCKPTAPWKLSSLWIWQHSVAYRLLGC
jgi:hypothetical protein